MKLGSLFDGSGGFPLAGALCGITPVWASEVEPYPIAVTRSRFPSMRHLGDVSKVSGADIEPVDIITFGSPCQDLSVAGKRAGLKHTENGDEETTRSGLFMEAVRIIEEMREKSGGKYPTFAVWENVPGAFSSNKGEDFKTVLEELAKVADPEAAVPRPPKGKWPKEGSIMGDGWSLAWRTMDAQYWGVSQRRRRIYLVADFGGERAGKILFECEGLRGYFEEGRTPWKGTPAHVGGSPAAADREGELIVADNIGGNAECAVRSQKCGTLKATHYKNPPVLCDPVLSAGFKAGQSMAGGIGWQEECAATLSAQCSETEPTVCVCYDARGNGDGKTAPTITRGHNNRVTDYTALMMESVYCLQGNGQPNSLSMEEIAKPLDCMHDAQAILAECAGVDCRNMNEYPELYPTLQAKLNGGQSLNFSGAVRIWYIVRRLTPTECARLQGFADHWGVPDHKDDFSDVECKFWQEVRDTYAEINGKPMKQYTKAQLLKWYNGLHTDSAEYKMWGNGIALPTALYVMQGIKEQEE